jgi:hypothetical protein
MRRSAHATKLASLAADEGQEGEWDLVAEVSDMLWEQGLHQRGLDNDVSEVNVGRDRLNPLPQELISLVTEADQDSGDVQGRDFNDPQASIVEGKLAARSLSQTGLSVLRNLRRLNLLHHVIHHAPRSRI